MDAPDDGTRARRLAAGHVARRDLSRRRLTERLRRDGLGEEAADRVVDAFVEAGYVDDLRLARSRAGQLAARGYGDVVIVDRLEREGIEPAAIREALAGLVPESERVRSLIRGERDPVRAAARLARRGFTPESVEGVCEPPSALGMDEADPVELR